MSASTERRSAPVAVASELGAPPKIALFIPTLGTGGSERQLLELAKGMAQSRHDVLIVTMYEGGGFWTDAKAISGVKVQTLRKRNLVAFVWRLVALMRRERVCLIYAFLSTAQLYALLVKLALPRMKLVYRIGDSINPQGISGAKQALVNAVPRACKGKPAFCVLNSEAAKKVNVFAMSPDRLRVVHNGIDTDRFRPNAALRGEVRASFGIKDDVWLIGCVGTFSAFKDHMTFVEAARLVRATMRNVHFVTVGDDSTSQGQRVREYVAQAGMASWFRFLGLRKDVERLLPACDVGVSSSITEGFPNAICEFMASGVPCVVTDVGDSAAIVGDTGCSVPKSNPRALADGILTVLRMSPEDRIALGERTRRRIVHQFSVSRMVSETAEILSTALSAPRSGI